MSYVHAPGFQGGQEPPSPLLVNHGVAWDGNVKVEKDAATTTVVINNERYTISYFGEKGKDLDANAARQIITSQIDTMVILGTRYIGGDTKAVLWDPAKKTITREYAGAKAAKKEKPVTINDFDREFGQTLYHDYLKHNSRLVNVRQPDPPNLGPGPLPVMVAKPGKEDEFNKRNARLNRINAAQRLFHDYIQSKNQQPQPQPQPQPHAAAPPPHAAPPPAPQPAPGVAPPSHPHAAGRPILTIVKEGSAADQARAQQAQAAWEAWNRAEQQRAAAAQQPRPAASATANPLPSPPSHPPAVPATALPLMSAEEAARVAAARAQPAPTPSRAPAPASPQPPAASASEAQKRNALEKLQGAAGGDELDDLLRLLEGEPPPPQPPVQPPTQ